MNRKQKDSVFIWVMRFFAYLMVFVVGYIIVDIVMKGAGTISWDFISKAPSRAGMAGGIFPAIIGTLYLVGLAIVIALPLGMATAVYLSEYAKRNWLTKIIRSAIMTLAGIPSIVFGLFGLGIFVMFLGFDRSILAGSLTLACLILPTIIVACEEALRAVPQSLREGSLALGATKWQTITKNVLPYAIPGMMTGSILGISRAAGETAPILLTASAFYLPSLPNSVFSQVMALPYHLFVLSTQSVNLTKAKPMQYGTALVLLIIIFTLNIFAILLRSYFRKKYKW
ncbi:MAG: phosphate ABC transporter permease PstA [Caldisericia bacterium]|nr:phosphate ABC transporter permease PstA [Caldisericia bacterium]